MGDMRRAESERQKRAGSRGDEGRFPSSKDSLEGPHTCITPYGYQPQPLPQLFPQVELGKSDSYLMTQSPLGSFERPVVTGELKGADTKVQVTDLWPHRSAAGAGVCCHCGRPKGPQDTGMGSSLIVTSEPLTCHVNTHPPPPSSIPSR